MKIKLKMHKDHWINPPMATLGMKYLLTSLHNSDLFDIEYHEETLKCMKDFRATILYANGKRIYLDLWDYATPTYTSAVYDANFDLIIKLQRRKMDFNSYFLRECRERKLFINQTDDELRAFDKKIIPWTFFPSKWFETYIGREHELFSSETKIPGFFCGKDWKCRRTCKKWMGRHKLEYMSSDQGLKSGKVLTNDEFLQKMKDSKLGFTFHGRSSVFSEAKNRREIDYLMMKKPLVLNYEPVYWNPMKSGVHFIRWLGESPKDLEKNYDLAKIAENGHQWYLDNATPKGIANSFKQIVEKELS